MEVLEHLPPQQGLRLIGFGCVGDYFIVLEHLPPQQGLRHTLRYWDNLREVEY